MRVSVYSTSLLMHCIARFPLAVVALSLLLHSSDVLASAPLCGASVDDAIAAAEKSLATNDENGKGRALTCLLEAVQLLNAQSHASPVGIGDPVAIAGFMNAIVDLLAEQDPTFRDRFTRKLKADKP